MKHENAEQGETALCLYLHGTSLVNLHLTVPPVKNQNTKA